MKTAKQPLGDASSSRRAQPIRQARTNPPRSSLPSARQFGSRASLGGLDDASIPEQTVEIFPAITHFADAIAALPKELVRHFTLLKEVDAKIFAPEESLANLVDAALNAPPPERRQPVETQNGLGPTSAHMSAQGSTQGSVTNGHGGSVVAVPDGVDTTLDATWDPANIPRRQIFQHCAYTMSNMLLSLDEKNHVIATAAEALNKQLARIDDCFPYIEREISEEARLGSLTHWAYPENRNHKVAGGTRRDFASANTLSAAAQRLADEAAARSDERKQAVAAKKNHKAHAESDFDDHHEVRLKDKRSHGSQKVRKAADASAGIGLGITNGTSTNGNPPKRRKVDKGQAGGIGMERALSAVFGTNGTATKKAASPRDTPPGDGPKKRARAPNAASGHSRKRNNTVTSIAMSPSLASSPIRSTFPDVKSNGRPPSPTVNGNRATATKGRQGSIQSTVDNSKQRPSSAAPNKQVAVPAGTSETPAVAGTSGRIGAEQKASLKENTPTSKGDQAADDTVQEDTGIVVPPVVTNRKEGTMKREEPEINGDSLQDIRTTTITTTKSGRASKPSTPHIPQFGEPTRSRSARNALEAASSNKRSHKKGAGAAAQQLLAARGREEEDSSLQGDEDDDDDINPDEPRYCYCNGVSYGEMVGCDGDTCEREWFHLECAGLRVAPKDKVKWYCDDCKEKNKIGTKKFNSR